MTPYTVSMSLSGSLKQSADGRSRRVASDARLVDLLSANGYTGVCVRENVWCGVAKFNHTYAIVVGLDEIGYHHRYCYEQRADAETALASWDGREHPSGPWIKCKGAGVEFLNPAFR